MEVEISRRIFGLELLARPFVLGVLAWLLSHPLGATLHVTAPACCLRN